MLKKLAAALFLALSTLVIFITTPTFAKSVGPFRQGANPNVTVTGEVSNPTEDQSQVTFVFTSNQDYFDPKTVYAFLFLKPGDGPDKGCGNYDAGPRYRKQEGGAVAASSTTLNVTLNLSACKVNHSSLRGEWILDIWQNSRLAENRDKPNFQIAKVNFSIAPQGGEPTLSANCQISEGQPLPFEIGNAQAGMTYSLWINGAWEHQPYKVTSSGTYSNSFNPKDDQKKGKQKICMDLGDTNKNCKYFIDVQYVKGAPDLNCKKDSAPTAKEPGAGNPTQAFQFIGCSSTGGSGIQTALGCIPTDNTNNFVGWFLKWALGIAGGVAFILMIMAGFQIMTGGGNPDKVQGGRELLNAAISGLVLIIFSIFLLKLIGVDILGLPGFGN